MPFFMSCRAFWRDWLMPSDPSGPAPTCTPTYPYHTVSRSVDSPFSMHAEMGDSYVASVSCFCAKCSRNDSTASCVRRCEEQSSERPGMVRLYQAAQEVCFLRANAWYDHKQAASVESCITWICWMSCTVERREMLEEERKEDFSRCSLRALGPPAPRNEPTSSVCSTRCPH